MKKNLKCLTALCMAGAMISLTGCGSSSQSTSADTTAGSASSEATTSAESTASGNGSKTVIEYWHCNAENQGGLTVDELVKNFNENNDHIEVVAKYNPDMYKGLMQYPGTGSDRLGFPGLFFQQLFLHLPTGDHRPV